jgi:NTP pyrophosphatase (non-canonical NTP hydrolase)|tara:strand:+ start:8085 stop:8363 length:279 start_codon:yes stop_codon:yes gene_type:complete
MQDIISANYQSIVDRGFITPTTTLFEFLDKLQEEVEELKKEALISKEWSNLPEELADVILVCLNMAKHYNIDIEQEIKNKIRINEYRAKQGK